MLFSTSSRTNYISHHKALGGSRLFRRASRSISLFRAQRWAIFWANTSSAKKDYQPEIFSPGSLRRPRCLSSPGTHAARAPDLIPDVVLQCFTKHTKRPDLVRFM